MMTRTASTPQRDDGPDLMLGTAGHIDHGKSSLIRALTGTDPDRLSEEKRRGITIELGFARLALPGGRSMGVVDVPGHERFVRQMIAGATGIDMALLCIAADDGIMPQTVEHLAVLELLGVPSIVVALTKVDLVDDEWALFVADEIAQALENTPYATAPIVGVSSRNGYGLDALKEAIAANARIPARRREGRAVRMPIDRVFTIKGAGTVVTGTLWDGKVRVDDEVEILPAKTTARVRSVEMHGRKVEAAEAGNRVALNLSAVKTSELRRGDFLASPKSASLTDRFDAWFTYLGQDGTKPFETGTRVHIAHGTREVTGRVLLMEKRFSLDAHESCYAQVRLDAPLPVASDDRFIARSYSPVRVIGGGRVLANRPKRRTVLSARDTALLDALRERDMARICEAALAMQDHLAPIGRIAENAGIEPSLMREGLSALVAKGKVALLDAKGEIATRDADKELPPTVPDTKDARLLAAHDVKDGLFMATHDTLAHDLSALENELLRFHAENPLQAGIAKTTLLSRLFAHMDRHCFDALLAEAARTGRIALEQGRVSHARAAATARTAQKRAEEDILAALEQSGRAPAPIDDVIAECGADAALCRRAVSSLARDGRIVKAGKTLYFARTVYDSLESDVRAFLKAAGGATVSELKDAMGLTRKYATPLLELMDERGVTVRNGDMRSLR